MAINVYMDESGDLGWNLDKEYRKGGSSRYFTIASICCPPDKKNLLTKIINDIYKANDKELTAELKGANLSQESKCKFCGLVRLLLHNNRDIVIQSITIKKTKENEYLGKHSGCVYNYMAAKMIQSLAKGNDIINIMRDTRNAKSGSTNSLKDYLQTEVLFAEKTQTLIQDYPLDSKNAKNIIFADWLNNIIWSHYENGEDVPFDILNPVIYNIEIIH